MTTPDRTRPLAAVAIALVALALVALAGDLDPPGGTTTPTMKTLDEVEPRTLISAANTPGDADSTFKITAPGSYYLTDNATGEAGKHGIEITSGNVSIDLMGFTLSGVPGSLDGIKTTVLGLQNIAIRNGSIVGWASNGIDIGLMASENSIVEDIRASNNTLIGIRIGHNTVLNKCVCSDNQSGVISGVACTFTECTVRNCVQGLSAGFGGVVSNCVAHDNGTNGFVVSTGTITNCTAAFNGLNGIQAQSGTTVIGCTAHSSGGSGFWANSDCIFLNNTSRANTQAGIFVFADKCRIEGNNCLENTTGIEIDGAANYIVRNVCTDNTTNFDFASDNRFGEIVNHKLSSTAPISGDSAPGAMGTTDPWANFANQSPP